MGRVGAALLAGALATGMLSACSAQASSPQSEPAPLAESGVSVGPELTASQLAQYMVSSTESAIGDRLDLFASLADSCNDCASVLDAEAVASAQRLAGSGGPWLALAPPQDGGTPHSLVDLRVPFTVDELAAFMALTSQGQLEALALSAQVPGGDRMVLAGVLVGRTVSAVLLAEDFEVDLEDAVSNLRPESLPQFTSEEALGPNVSDDGNDGVNVDPTAAASEALVSFDCVASSLIWSVPAGGNKDGQHSALIRRSEQIQDRTSELIAAGVPNQRSVRCDLGALEPEEVFSQLIRADLLLFVSDNEQARMLGANWAYQDAWAWAQLAAPSAPTVTPLLPAPAVQDSEE